jgi:hypothetical protein
VDPVNAVFGRSECVQIARRERGAIGGISELVCVIAISIALIAGSFMLVDPFSSALSSAVRDTQGVFDRARGLAPADGATITFAASGTQTLVKVYPHRPNGPIGTPVVEQSLPSVAVTSGGTSTFGIFLDKNGTVSEMPSFTAGTIVGAPPACTTGLTLTFVHGVRSENHSISCLEARVR